MKRQYLIEYSKEKGMFELTLLQDGIRQGGACFNTNELMLPLDDDELGAYLDFTWLKEMTSEEINKAVRAQIKLEKLTNTCSLGPTD